MESIVYMLEIINNAFAQEAVQAAAKQPSAWSSIIPLALIMVVFYFLLIRPQHKKMKDHQSLVSSIKRGDKVVTNSGIFGEVVKVDEDAGILHLSIAENVVVRLRRDTVGEVLGKEQASKPKHEEKALAKASSKDKAKASKAKK